MKQHPHDPPMHVTQVPRPKRPSAPALNAKAQKVAKLTPKGKGGPNHATNSGKTVPVPTLGRGVASPRVLPMPK